MATPLLLLQPRLRRLLPFLVASGATFTAQAQPEPIKCGQIDKADLTAAPFVGDSAAVARDYVPRLDFELTGEQWNDTDYHDLSCTWTTTNATLLADDDLGGRLGRPGPLKEQAQALTTKYPTVVERTAAVRQLVVAALRYNGQNRCYAQEPLRKAYDARQGSGADVNLLLIAALREAGIEAYPLLLSTRNHGRVSKAFLMLERFNCVVAVVPLADGKGLLVDATEPLLPGGVLPARCLRSSSSRSKRPAGERGLSGAPVPGISPRMNDIF